MSSGDERAMERCPDCNALGECTGECRPLAGERADAIPEAAVDALIWESPYGLQRHTARRMIARVAPFLRAAQPEAESEEGER